MFGRVAHLRRVNPTLAVAAMGMGMALGASNAPAQAKKVDAKDFLLAPLSADKTPADSIEFDTTAPMRERMKAMILRVQDEICTGMEAIDGTKFRTDEWERDGHGGGGRSRVIQDGKVFEKAGVNVSVIHGDLKKGAVAQMNSQGRNLEVNKPLPFFACGVSLVIHPRNPMAPTMHLNYRYFEVETGRLDEAGKPKKLAWFGGGADLTPAYLFEEDARHFHAVYKIALDKHDKSYYPQMKETCDKYFYIPHRQEHRGIGGFFYDDMDKDMEKTFQMARSCANSMLDAYVPIMLKRKDMPFTQAQKDWQQVRRGRYVEFNVMYDRGTKFGLNVPGSRIESILMSLPLTARWEYMNIPKEGSWEARTLEVLKNPVDWLNVEAVNLETLSTKELLAEIARRSESA
ncbi:coproporphyrinogen III oxidase [Saprolegnia diclina VS20]|uniref:coproporphyrinogen oxidase n=1 Tax=Saprolegnia diclina (strain VS20) TaxID=1156394 RepID=T0S215_SAPDV|nr:coproporphyrinogen III oxidase [Saprolegnia diclina VS20]EQC36822.1 coproporphyrinogen III oxidase [Saprolegnia diclina VS20]|eukprot:XP_008609603.1 coproporphyrinogen III oxidase [Saprolegnia diclina VS20]